jgi:hypothetical protein
VIERQLLAWGVQPDGFAVRDGSGLSRHDFVSPETIVRVLDVVRRSPNFVVFYDALPIAGVDGTIGNRMRVRPRRATCTRKRATVDRARVALRVPSPPPTGEMLVVQPPVQQLDGADPARWRRVQDEIAVRLAALSVQGAVTRARAARAGDAPPCLSVAEASERILADVRRLSVERVPLLERARSRARAGRWFAPLTIPPWDNSAMDGYAVRSRRRRGPRRARAPGGTPGERDDRRRRLRPAAGERRNRGDAS